MPTHPDQSKSKANKLKKLANFISQTVQFINFPVVRVLVDEKLKLLPEKWLAEHKKMDIGNVASCSREKLAENEEKETDLVSKLSFQSFIDQTLSLSALSQPVVDRKHLANLKRMRKLSYKKSVELDLFGQFLVEKCVENKIDRVLDVGCGLGHLLGWIGEKLPNLELVGVDCNDSFCDKGTKIYGQVKFNVLEISLENCQDFLDLLQNTGKRTALISLHGCGDLQETLIKAFLKCNISKVPLLLTIGCCYHKTKKPDNWIISDFLKNQLGYVNINGSALRMGAEMRFNDYINMSEAERAKRLNSLMIRAVTEVFYQRNDINALIEHRSRRRNLGNTISEAAEAIASRYGVEDDVKELWLKEMLAIEQEFQGERDKIQLFLDIQYSLQHVMESLILLDRAQYVEENGGTAELIPLFPTDISPRNTCLTVKR